MNRLLVLLVLLPCLLSAQEEPSNLGTLRALVESMSALRSQLDQQNAKAKSGENEAIKTAAKKDAESLQQRLDQAQDDFESIATGVDDDEDIPPVPGKLDITSELTDLLGPLIQELKQVTEQPRRIEALRREVATQRNSLETARHAAAKAAGILGSVPKAKENTQDAALHQALVAAQKKWTAAVSEAQANLDVAELHLSEALSQRKSIWEILTNTAKGFFLTRGLNLVLAVVTFFLAFLSWRWMHRWFTRFSPWHRTKGERSFFARVLDVLYHATALVIGVVVSMIVLYTMGDWLLLGLSLIALLALVLAAKNGLPRYYAQARLLLNLGDVREGERVVVNGLPWQVRSLNLVSELVNPALQHGTMRLPIQQITALSSRPYEQGELWFPCKEGDWVQLADGTFGKAVTVTAEFVQLVQLGGAHKTYTTSAFLAQNAVNFTGGFRVTAIVKVHPEHRALATTVIPDAMKETIHEGLLAMVEPAQIRSIKVEFRAVIPNALEFDVTADFDGEVAEKLPSLQRALQTHALAACNANDWKLGG